WYMQDKRHREDGPAIEYTNGDKRWYIEEKELTEEEFNARPKKTVRSDGTIEWRVNGQLHREDGPAVEDVNCNKYWYIKGKLHRENGPAIEDAYGYKAWYMDGKRHRENGPAIEDSYGYKAWYMHGIWHRENGPAIESSDGRKAWYMQGKL